MCTCKNYHMKVKIFVYKFRCRSVNMCNVFSHLVSKIIKKFKKEISLNRLEKNIIFSSKYDRIFLSEKKLWSRNFQLKYLLNIVAVWVYFLANINTVYVFSCFYLNFHYTFFYIYRYTLFLLQASTLYVFQYLSIFSCFDYMIF